jgi:hypothetical protein
MQVSNVYFESTPLELFSGIITEEGLLEPAVVAQIEEKHRREAVAAFGLEPVTALAHPPAPPGIDNPIVDNV